MLLAPQVVERHRQPPAIIDPPLDGRRLLVANLFIQCRDQYRVSGQVFCKPLLIDGASFDRLFRQGASRAGHERDADQEEERELQQHDRTAEAEREGGLAGSDPDRARAVLEAAGPGLDVTIADFVVVAHDPFREPPECTTLHQSEWMDLLEEAAAAVTCASLAALVARASRREAIEGHLLDKDETPATREADDKAPFAALAFKIATDPFVGSLTFFRVYSGTFRADGETYNLSRGSKERFGSLLAPPPPGQSKFDQVLEWAHKQQEK